jgi:hypothetical protein
MIGHSEGGKKKRKKTRAHHQLCSWELIDSWTWSDVRHGSHWCYMYHLRLARASTLHCRYNTEQPTALAPMPHTTKLKLDEKNKNRKKSRLLFLILSIFENIFMTSLDEPMFIFIWRTVEKI